MVICDSSSVNSPSWGSQRTVMMLVASGRYWSSTRMSVPVRFDRAGRHTVTLWMVDPTVVVQRFVLVTNPDEGDLRWTYLGPPTSAWRP